MRLLPGIFLGFTLTQCVSEQDILGARAGSGGSGGNLAESGGSSGASNVGGTLGSGGAASGGMQGGQEANGGSGLGGQAASGGQAQGGQAGAGGWTEATCFEALARGKDGDSCKGIFSCSTVARPPTTCCHSQATCGPSGTLTLIGEICDDCTCTVDANCPSQFWCTDGKCRRCVQPPPGAYCARGLIPYPRNGCTWCVLPNECGMGPPGVPPPTCSPDEECYAGRTCLPACQNDPGCCFGNICERPGCGGTQEVDCSIVGCPDGLMCAANFVQECDCLGGRWSCASPRKNTCAAQ